MKKSGLAALAESYGLERAELHHLKLLGERFFDQLREELARFTARPIRLAELKQWTDSFESFCTTPGYDHIMILGFGDESMVAVRMDRAFALGLISAVLRWRERDEVSGSGELAPLTVAEAYILANTLGDALVRTVGLVFGALFGRHTGLRMIAMEHRPGLVANTFSPTERLVAAGVKCLLGSSGGAVEMGVSLSALRRVRARLVPAMVKPRDPAAALRKARQGLAGASLELAAVLGDFVTSFDQVRALGPGSVVTLQKMAGTVPRVELRAGEQVLCAGTVAEDRGWYRFLVGEKGAMNDDPAAKQ
jgi:hypothetical protein